MITQVLTPFDSTKQAIEGTTSFRANASYSWSWLIEHSNQQNTLISQINSTTTEMNSLAQTVTTKAQEVANNTTTVNQAKLDAQSARDSAIAANNAAQAIYDTFDDRYLGTKTTAPIVDNDGNALQSGALYFNSTSGKLFIYDLVGAKWVDITTIPTLLSSLSDVAFTTKSNNDVLQYDSATGKWVNRSFYSKAELDAFITGKIPKITTPTTNAVPRIKADGTLENSAITIDDNGNIGSGTQSFNGFGGSGFKNVIINGKFNVNQYGRLPYVAQVVSAAYIDCWKSANSGTGTLTLSEDSITYSGKVFKAMKATATTAITLGANTRYYAFGTNLEANNVSSISTDNMTLSFLFECSRAGKYSVVLLKCDTSGVGQKCYITSFTATVGAQQITIPIPADSYQVLTSENTGIIVQIGFVTTYPTSITSIDGWLPLGTTVWMKSDALSWGDTVGAYIKIADVNLEPGLSKSPSENRPVSLELAFCQRYCFNPKYGSDGNNQVVRGDCYGVDNVNGWINFKFPVPMRITPYLYLSSGFSQLYLGYPESMQLTALSQSIVSCNEAVFAYSVASGNTANRHYHLYIPNSANKILFTAEL